MKEDIRLPFNLPAATLKHAPCRVSRRKCSAARVFVGHLQSPRWPPLASPGASKIDLDGRFVTGHFVVRDQILFGRRFWQSFQSRGTELGLPRQI